MRNETIYIYIKTLYNNRHNCSYIKIMLCCVSFISKSQATVVKRAILLHKI